MSTRQPTLSSGNLGSTLRLMGVRRVTFDVYKDALASFPPLPLLLLLPQIRSPRSHCALPNFTTTISLNTPSPHFLSSFIHRLTCCRQQTNVSSSTSSSSSSSASSRSTPSSSLSPLSPSPLFSSSSSTLSISPSSTSPSPQSPSSSPSPPRLFLLLPPSFVPHQHDSKQLRSTRWDDQLQRSSPCLPPWAYMRHQSGVTVSSFLHHTSTTSLDGT